MQTQGTGDESRLRRVASRLVFPVAIASGLWGVFALVQGGVASGIAVLAILVPAAFTIGILERVLPYRREWLRSDQDIGADFTHMLVEQITLPKLLTPAWTSLLAGASVAASQYAGGAIWPHQWPLLAQLFLMLTIAEFGRYWVHRAAHTFPLLWRFHEVHHSSNRLYWLNAGRFHPLEKVLFLIPETVPFILLGTGPETLSLYFVFNGIHGLLQHSNIYLRLGWLNYLFSMTELHRWHHSKLIEESNKNYGNNLIVWDLVFGTYFLPVTREVGPVGLLEKDYPKGYIGQLVEPFRKRTGPQEPSRTDTCSGSTPGV